MICDASRLTTFVLTTSSAIAPEPRLVYSAVSHAASLFAIALLGVLQQGGPHLFSGFHMAMALAMVKRTRALKGGNDGQEHHQRDNAFA